MQFLHMQYTAAAKCFTVLMLENKYKILNASWKLLQNSIYSVTSAKALKRRLSENHAYYFMDK